MARMNVNPTRMELKRLKGRLGTAVRGHKLLKDKSDEMIRRFSILIRKNKQLREDVEKELSSVLKEFQMVRSMGDISDIEKSFSIPTSTINADYETQNIMSVITPKITIKDDEAEFTSPYSFAEITSEADYSVKKTAQVIKKLMELAEVEKTVSMLAVEIERNKRRVNALEFILIPQLEETIKYITGKLGENERAATTRLMKVKSMIADRE